VTKIILGCIVKDVVTGFQGTVTARLDQANGNIMWGVTPTCGEDGKYPDAMFFDNVALDFIEPHLSERVIDPGPIAFELGIKAKDKLTGFEGVTYERNTFMNGCVHYTLVGGELNKDGKPVQHIFDQGRIIPIAGTTAAFEPPAPDAPRTGGPARRVPSQRV
jgi:hypothetical protein